jgi:hypothetical protein
MKVLKIIKERVYKAGYILRKELVETPCVGEPPMEWTMAYTPSGAYIGTPTDAHRLCNKRGIQPQKRSEDHCVCSIGFSLKDGKWYGWSHRALYGFKIGSTCKKGDCHYTPRRNHGRGAWVAKTVADARQMACDFAEGVS